jgi:acetyl-CoA carboxylase biotin carboxyl carrier protein
VSLRYDEIAEILKMIDSSSCDELIVETGDVKLVVRRNGAHGASPAIERPTTPAAPSTAAPAQRSAPSAPAVQPGKTETGSGKLEVTAPMVGTFYRAPTPDAPVFVEVGSVVKKGQPLCLIEVMKLFTTINSEFDGRIVQIGAENGELVEYGRVLFVIEPA